MSNIIQQTSLPGGGGGSGSVNGPGSSTDNAIVVWNGTTGTLIKDSFAIMESSGAIMSQGFIENRQILRTTTVPDKFIMISKDVELTSGDLILQGDGELIIV